MKHQKNSGFSIFIVLIVVVVIAVLGVVAYVTLKNPRMEESLTGYNSKTETTGVLTSPTPAASDSAEISAIEKELESTVVQTTDTDFQELNSSASSL